MAKKVISPKVYNTETAELVHGYWNGLSTSDFRNVSEDLYRTKNGNYFILGSGGAMSKYAVSCGNSMCGSSDNIVPISEEEVINWLEKHDGDDVITKLFADRLQEA